MNYKVRMVARSTGYMTTFAGTGMYGSSSDGGLASMATLSYPSALAVDSSDNVYIADGSRLRVVTRSDGIITTVAGQAGMYGNSGDGGAATIASFSYINGVAVDVSGNVYIEDQMNFNVRVVTRSTGIVTTIAGTGVYGSSSGDGGPATSAQLSYIAGVAVDASGNVFITDSNKVREVVTSRTSPSGATGQSTTAVTYVARVQFSDAQCTNLVAVTGTVTGVCVQADPSAAGLSSLSALYAQASFTVDATGASTGTWVLTYYSDSACVSAVSTPAPVTAVYAVSALSADSAAASCVPDASAASSGVYWRTVVFPASQMSDIMAELEYNAGHGLVVASYGDSKCAGLGTSPNGMPVDFSWSLGGACVYQPSTRQYSVSSCLGALVDVIPTGSSVTATVTTYSDAACSVVAAGTAPVLATFKALTTCWRSAATKAGYQALGPYEGGYCQARSQSQTWAPTFQPTGHPVLPTSPARPPTYGPTPGHRRV